MQWYCKLIVNFIISLLDSDVDFHKPIDQVLSVSSVRNSLVYQPTDEFITSLNEFLIHGIALSCSFVAIVLG